MERELVQHIGIFGRTGAGKSYLVRSLLLTHLLYNKPVLLFDWKGTYTDIAGSGNVLLFIPGSSAFPFYFNPLSLEGIPLIEALDIILRSKGLRYRLEPNLIYVSTLQGLADNELITRVYHLKTGIAAVPEIELKEWEKEYETE